jgi:hypothetical protein
VSRKDSIDKDLFSFWESALKCFVRAKLMAARSRIQTATDTGSPDPENSLTDLKFPSLL